MAHELCIAGAIRWAMHLAACARAHCSRIVCSEALGTRRSAWARGGNKCPHAGLLAWNHTSGSPWLRSRRVTSSLACPSLCRLRASIKSLEILRMLRSQLRCSPCSATARRIGMPTWLSATAHPM
eukprot:scaffold2776_cov36-Tisochrysis_lutea.AAC.2